MLSNASPSKISPISQKPPQPSHIQKVIEDQKIRQSQSIATLHKNFKEQLKFKSIAQLVPLAKIIEMQDVLVDLNQAQFQELPKNYIEELMKLSAIINYQVKTYQFNNKMNQH